MSKDITPQLFQRYFEAGKLGSLKIEIPECYRCTEMKVNLDELFRHSTSIKFFEYQTRPKDIVSMCIFGSTLYKHFLIGEREIEEKILKKPTIQEEEKSFLSRIISRLLYKIFNNDNEALEVVNRAYKVREAPEDFDVMVVTKEGLTADKLIIPQTRTEGDNYGSWQVIDHSAVETKKLIPNEYGYVEVRGGKELHIVYRSVEQLLNGIGKGDTVSESVVRYGIPIIGQRSFEDVIQGVTMPKREPLHQIEWTEDLEGKLQGKIL